MVKRVVLLLILAAVLITVLWLGQRAQTEQKVSGFVEADEIRLGSRVGGRVKEVHVEEGQCVERGQPLVELEPFDLLERRSQLQAQRAQAQATLDRLHAGFRTEEVAQAKARVDQLAANLEKLEHGPRQQEIDAAVAELELAQSELELAQTRHQRAETLLAQRAISQEQYDAAATELRVARSRVKVRQDTLALLREGTRKEDIDEARAQLEQATQAWRLQQRGYRTEEIAEAAAAVQAATAAAAAIDRQLDELRILAPVDGTIEAVELQPGDLVPAGAPVISMIDTSRLWVRAYVPENWLHLQLGDQLPIRVSSYPDEPFLGRITFIARQAEFTPGNVQTPEERSKQVFRIKVTLLSGSDRLRPGMSADIWLDQPSPRQPE
jgi:multidrug resistance efflux pump